MRCPKCASLDDKVVDSREAREGDAVRRRRECLACGHRFTTFERPEMSVPLIVKRDGRREPFSREKLLAGLQRACAKRPVSIEMLQGVVNRIERAIAESGDAEVSFRAVGDLVMEELRALDDIAYLRFASVYRSFQDLGELLAEARRVRDRRTP